MLTDGNRVRARRHIPNKPTLCLTRERESHLDLSVLRKSFRAREVVGGPCRIEPVGALARTLQRSSGVVSIAHEESGGIHKDLATLFSRDVKALDDRLCKGVLHCPALIRIVADRPEVHIWR